MPFLYSILVDLTACKKIEKNWMRVVVFGSSSCKPGSTEYIQAEKLGMLLAQSGFGVVTGGYSGTMEAVSKGANSIHGTQVSEFRSSYVTLL